MIEAHKPNTIDLPTFNKQLLTLSVHAREGYISYFFCVSVCVYVCLSETDFEDGLVLSLQMGIKFFHYFHLSLLLPARASEQGNVIGSVSVYIYIYMSSKKNCN